MSIIEETQTETRTIKIEEDETALKSRILKRAAKILEQIGWCQHGFYNGDENSLISNKAFMQAHSYCMLGAIYRAEIELGIWRGEKKSLLWPDIIKQEWICAEWNDEPERTKDEVIARLLWIANKYEIKSL
jgi:hypothetical protein